MEAGEVDIRNEGGNIFVFTFSTEEQRNLVWKKIPWAIANSFLNLKKWDGIGDPRHIDFRSADMWIHIHRLPQMYKSVDNMKVLGGLYFRYINCDRAGLEQGGWRRYIRIFVEIRIDEPLQVLGELPTEKREVIEFKYEKILDYCLYCGMMGHTESKCEQREEEIMAGGAGDLPGLYEHSIRAASEPRSLPSDETYMISLELSLRSNPSSEERERSLQQIHNSQGRNPTGPQDSTARNLSSQVSGDLENNNSNRSGWITPPTAFLFAGTNLDTRGYQAMRAGLIPRRIEGDLEEGDEGEGNNPNTAWAENTNLGLLQVSPLVPPGFEGTIRNQEAITGLRRGEEMDSEVIPESQATYVDPLIRSPQIKKKRKLSQKEVFEYGGKASYEIGREEGIDKRRENRGGRNIKRDKQKVREDEREAEEDTMRGVETEELVAIRMPPPEP
ncbi:hypothetical protein LINGRAHAP2_LOCUS5118 [Linum grandiflorum]